MFWYHTIYLLCFLSKAFCKENCIKYTLTFFISPILKNIFFFQNHNHFFFKIYVIHFKIKSLCMKSCLNRWEKLQNEGTIFSYLKFMIWKKKNLVDIIVFVFLNVRVVFRNTFKDNIRWISYLFREFLTKGIFWGMFEST